MELETLFTASKWEILRHLSEQPLSPLQLAERSSTSLANISQQLRLLEMAGLVKSTRVPNRDKGQPRILYSLAGDQGYVIAAADDFVEKKLLKLSSYNKIILRIWLFDDPSTRYALEKSFWRIEHLLPRIRRLFVNVKERAITFCIEGEPLPAEELTPSTLTLPDGGTVTIMFTQRAACERSVLLYAAEERR